MQGEVHNISPILSTDIVILLEPTHNLPKAGNNTTQGVCHIGKPCMPIKILCSIVEI